MSTSSINSRCDLRSAVMVGAPGGRKEEAGDEALRRVEIVEDRPVAGDRQPPSDTDEGPHQAIERNLAAGRKPRLRARGTAAFRTI